MTEDEADKLLKEIKTHSQAVYEMALMSLRTGARAEEVFGIKWGDVDLTGGTISLWDTKNKQSGKKGQK